MPSIYQIKPRFQALLRPLVRSLAAGGVTANQVTLAAAVLSIAAGAILAVAAAQPAVWFLLPVVLFLRMALNAIDGMLAREHNQKSALGAYLNELCDVISLTPAIRPNRRSSGIATAVAIVCGDAPGKPALTVIVGKSTRGSGATGRCVNAAEPARSRAAASSDVAIGRRMNGAEMFIHSPFPVSCGGSACP